MLKRAELGCPVGSLTLTLGRHSRKSHSPSLDFYVKLSVVWGNVSETQDGLLQVREMSQGRSQARVLGGPIKQLIMQEALPNLGQF